MRGLLFAIGLLVAPVGALALTWNFDDGTTWGWIAQESLLAGRNLTTVYSEVENGVWRIKPVPGGRQPAITLYSPPIGEDSALFDYVTLRLRTIHDRPTEGNVQMAWFNAEYKRLKEESGYRGLDSMSKFYTVRYQLYSTQWQDITIDLRALEAALEGNVSKESSWWQTEIVWQDTLFNFQIELDLNNAPQGLADHPAFVEVDWIRLTGAEELLLGELPPRSIAAPAGMPGALFAAPRFFPLGEGIETEDHPVPQQALGDVDGDGDVDMVVAYVRSSWGDGEIIEIKTETGWVVASNDGLGGFVPTQEVLLFKGKGFYPQPAFDGGDFNGDGLLDLAVTREASVELLYNQGQDGFETVLQLFEPDFSFVGLADGDGDGDVDLLGVEGGGTGSNVIMWFNDGDAGFVRRDRFDLNTEEKLFPRLLPGQSLGEAVRLLWMRPCYLPQGALQLTQPWALREEPPLFFETEVNPCYQLHLLADLDGDGTGEFVGPPERDLQFDFRGITTYHGLVLWRLDASGGMSRHPLLGPQVQVSHRAIAHDLTGDGLLDLAVVDGNLATGPALVVLTGQRAGLPIVEGRYRLPGTGGPVLAGDVNGDEAADLVVLGRSVEGGPGGAFVFLNQSTPATAIAAETATVPSAFVLGANYPNPFNPATTIPLALPAGAEEVDLTIYNVLGQPVRQVWTGSLAAGEHRLAWDGRDAEGQPVAAGVYWYRLQVDDQTHTRKMVKIE